MTTATLGRPKAKRLWTYDEMVAELEETNLPTELWDGELVMSPALNPDHQRIVRNFFLKLHHFVADQKLGEILFSPVDVVLTPRRVVQPDVLFVSQSRKSIIQNHVNGVPDLAMELISEGSWQRDRVQEKALYEQSGLPEYWIVDPDPRTIEVFALVDGAYRLHSKATVGGKVRSKLLPGFEISFSDLVT